MNISFRALALGLALPAVANAEPFFLRLDNHFYDVPSSTIIQAYNSFLLIEDLILGSCHRADGSTPGGTGPYVLVTGTGFDFVFVAPGTFITYRPGPGYRLIHVTSSDVDVRCSNALLRDPTLVFDPLFSDTFEGSTIFVDGFDADLIFLADFEVPNG